MSSHLATRHVPLVGLIALTSSVVWPVFEDGRVLAVLYREPKLAVLHVLLSLLLVGALWRFRRPLREIPGLAAVRRGPFPLLFLFLGWSAVTGTWARVRENWWYEISQWALLAGLILLVRTWARFDKRIRDLVVGAIVVTTAGATLVGLAQGFGLKIPVFLPVAPELGVVHASWMGFKNPMALAVLAQIHLVAWLRFRARDPGQLGSTPVGRILLSSLLGIELLYLATLQSRTSWLALAVSAPWILWFFLRDDRHERPSGRVWVGVIVVLVALALALSALPGTRDRLLGLGQAAQDQVVELRGDRMVYLLNTVEMVRAHPFGVGSGNWQVHYPVFRAHDRYLAFTEEVQVRRAHNDYAQVLGETGWTGLGLWVMVLLSSILTAWRSSRNDRRREASFGRFLAVQIGAIAVAGCTDYFTELPTHRFLLALLLALVALPERPPDPPRDDSWQDVALRCGLTVVFLGFACSGAALFAKSDAAIKIEIAWARAGHVLDSSRGSLFAELDEPGRRFLALPGHDKRFHRTYLALARAAVLAGDRQLAHRLAARSVRLHPFFPNALSFLASTAPRDRPLAAAGFVEAWDYVLHQATHGYRRPYPELPPEESDRELRRDWIRVISERSARGAQVGGQLPACRHGPTPDEMLVPPVVPGQERRAGLPTLG